MADISLPAIRSLNAQQAVSLSAQAVQARAQRQANLEDNAQAVDQRLTYRVPTSNAPDPTQPRQPAYARGAAPAPQDGGPNPAQIQRQEDQRYDQQLGRRVDGRQDVQAEITRQQDLQLDAARAAEARTRDALDQARARDAEQIVRAQQQVEDLRRLEQQRQDAIDAARQTGEAVPRGQVLDVVA